MRRSLFLLSVLLLASVSGIRAQESASDILARTTKALKKDCVTADFRSISPMGETSGTIILSRDRFFLDAGGIQTWFDGKTQWSYLPSSDEVNILTPTAEQLESINPYSFLALPSNGYQAQKASPSKAGLLAVELKTGDPGRSIQTLLLEIDPSTSFPERIVLNAQDKAGAVEILILSSQKGAQKPDAFFRFDLKAHPDTEIIDLR